MAELVVIKVDHSGTGWEIKYDQNRVFEELPAGSLLVHSLDSPCITRHIYARGAWREAYYQNTSEEKNDVGD